MALKKIWFSCEDSEHARLRLQLRYDKLNQKEFFDIMMKSYLDRDPEMLELVYKKTSHKRRKTINKKILKQEKIEKEIKEDFALDEDDIKNIFDIIASEDPDI